MCEWLREFVRLSAYSSDAAPLIIQRMGMGRVKISVFLARVSTGLYCSTLHQHGSVIAAVLLYRYSSAINVY